MNTDNFYVKYVGPDEDELEKGKIYPVKSVKIYDTYQGVAWPQLHFQFTAKGLQYERQIGDDSFVVVQEFDWVVQELGDIPKYGTTVSYKNRKFPWSGLELSMPIMRMIYES